MWTNNKIRGCLRVCCATVLKNQWVTSQSSELTTDPNFHATAITLQQSQINYLIQMVWQ